MNLSLLIVKKGNFKLDVSLLMTDLPVKSVSVLLTIDP